MRRDKVGRRQAAQAIASQMSLEEKAARAEYVLDNSGSWTATRDRVIALGRELTERFSPACGQESA